MQTPIIQYYDKLAGDYDENRFGNSYGQFIHTQETNLLDKWVTHREETVIDLACGTGRLSHYATAGIDASSEMLKIAQQKHPDKKFYLADATSIPLPDASVDTILCFHFFMHQTEETMTEILRECCRILKPGGRLIFDIPSRKRRNLSHRKTTGWHAEHSMTIRELSRNNEFSFTLHRYTGILFLPLHHIPRRLRKGCFLLDSFLAGSCLREYSSYLLIEMIKQ